MKITPPRLEAGAAGGVWNGAGRKTPIWDNRQLGERRRNSEFRQIVTDRKSFNAQRCLIYLVSSPVLRWGISRVPWNFFPAYPRIVTATNYLLNPLDTDEKGSWCVALR